jgi:hypothetical protein
MDKVNRILVMISSTYRLGETLSPTDICSAYGGYVLLVLVVIIILSKYLVRLLNCQIAVSDILVHTEEKRVMTSENRDWSCVMSCERRDDITGTH